MLTACPVPADTDLEFVPEHNEGLDGQALVDALLDLTVTQLQVCHMPQHPRMLYCLAPSMCSKHLTTTNCPSHELALLQGLIVPKGQALRIICKASFMMHTMAGFECSVNGTSPRVCHHAAPLQGQFEVAVGTTDVVELDSSTPAKFSRHLVVPLGGAAFASNAHVGGFVASLLAAAEGTELGESFYPQKVSSKQCDSAWAAVAASDHRLRAETVMRKPLLRQCLLNQILKFPCLQSMRSLHFSAACCTPAQSALHDCLVLLQGEVE